jgi:hypothetical protein
LKPYATSCCYYRSICFSDSPLLFMTRSDTDSWHPSDYDDYDGYDPDDPPPPPPGEPAPPPPPAVPPSSLSLRELGSVWAPPSDHLYTVYRPTWTPQVGEILIPYRLVDQMVWARPARLDGDGPDGIGQVLSTYDVVDRVEHPMGRADAMEVFSINDSRPGPPILYWRPVWVRWTAGTPFPVWIVRWLSATL